MRNCSFFFPNSLLVDIYPPPAHPMGFRGGSAVQKPPAIQETQETCVQSLCWEDPLEEGVATHSSIIAWRIPWTEEPGGLQFMGSQRVGHDWNNLACMHAPAPCLTSTPHLLQCNFMLVRSEEKLGYFWEKCVAPFFWGPSYPPTYDKGGVMKWPPP